MELKVWVDDVVRVVCGLTLSTSCKDVVIALAQSLGQTGRYLLVMRLRETERQLEAEDCPLQYLAQLGQLSADVQFILRRTGPSLDEGPHPGTRERPRPGSAASEPRSAQHRAPRKSSGSSSRPKRNNPNRSWSPSSRASPEPRASPVSFLSQTSSKEEVFRHVLLQQQQLQHLQALLQSLERETALWETDGTSAPPPGPDPALVEELEEQLRLNEAELLLGEAWEEELRAETDREREMYRRLQQMHSSLEDQGSQARRLQQQAEHLRRDLSLPSPGARGAPAPAPAHDEEELVRPLQEELRHRLQQARELDATLSQTQGELQSAEQRLQDGWRTVEDLNKELRQCKLQQFILQSGGLPPDQTGPQQNTNLYLINAGIVEQEDVQEERHIAEDPSICV